MRCNILAHLTFLCVLHGLHVVYVLDLEAMLHSCRTSSHLSFAHSLSLAILILAIIILSQNRTRQAHCTRTNRITWAEGGHPPGTSRHASKILRFHVICTERVRHTAQCLRSTERRRALWTSSTQPSAVSGTDGQAQDPTKHSEGV